MGKPKESTKETSVQKEPTLEDEVMYWMVITMLHDVRLFKARKGLLHLLGDNKDVAKLVHDGCDKKTLLDTLAFARALPLHYPPLGAAELNDLAKQVEVVLGRMKTVTPSFALPWVDPNPLPDGSFEITFLPTGADLHVQPQLEKWLKDKATLYRELARLCTEKRIPSRATIKKISYVWPAVYVNSCIGDPHYASVARLQGMTGKRVYARQLKNSYLWLKETYPGIPGWLLSATIRMQAFEKDNKAILGYMVVPKKE